MKNMTFFKDKIFYNFAKDIKLEVNHVESMEDEKSRTKLHTLT